MICVLVDDESVARRKLGRMLEDFPGIEIAGEADSIASAVSLLESTEVDLIFLDISLGAESGFDLLKLLPRSLCVVFVTGHHEHALSAFDANALDYLVKPIHPDRLRQCIEKIDTYNIQSLGGERCFLLKDLFGKVKRVFVAEICAISAQGDYTLVHAGDRDYLVRRTVKNWMEQLPESSFIKLSRSTILNTDAVSEICAAASGGADVFVESRQKPITLSQTEWLRLKKQL